MKQTSQSAIGTKFYGTILVATVNDLKKVLGKPLYQHNTGDDETNFEWISETNDGQVFTVYDLNENHPLSSTEDVRWRIGGKNHYITMQAHEEIIQAIIKIS